MSYSIASQSGGVVEGIEPFNKPESRILSPDSFSMTRFYPVDDIFVYKSSDLES